MPDPRGLVTVPDKENAVQNDLFAKFVAYFKSYMGKASIIAACLPIPLDKLNLIPTFHVLGFLPVITSMFCFLVVCYCFYVREDLVRFMFEPQGPLWRTVLVRALPLILAILCLGSFLGYREMVDRSVAALRSTGCDSSTAEILQKADWNEIYYTKRMIVFYVAVFACAEAAFTLMALREFLGQTAKAQSTRDLPA